MQAKLKTFTLYWLPLILYCVVIYVQSDHPSPESIPGFRHADKLLHFGAYGIMGILFVRAYRTVRRIANPYLLAVLGILSAGFYGISDEIHQFFVPFRTASVSDAAADMLGAVCFVSFYIWQVQRRIRKRARLSILSD